MLYRMKSGCDKSSYTGTKNCQLYPLRTHLFQISPEIWLTEKVSVRLFLCQVQSFFISSKLKCTVIQGGFSIVKCINKVCETIQNHFMVNSRAF